MRATPQGRKNELRLKIPCRTGATVYRKDFKHKQPQYRHQPLRQNMSTDCIKTNNFLRDEPIDLRISDKTNCDSKVSTGEQRQAPCGGVVTAVGGLSINHTVRNNTWMDTAANVV